jgi:hypothetical protein
VDGIDCRIREPRKIPSTEWFSQKFNGPGLTYELGIAIHQQKLVWIRGPVAKREKTHENGAQDETRVPSYTKIDQK